VLTCGRVRGRVPVCGEGTFDVHIRVYGAEEVLELCAAELEFVEVSVSPVKRSRPRGLRRGDGLLAGEGDPGWSGFIYTPTIAFFAELAGGFAGALCVVVNSFDVSTGVSGGEIAVYLSFTALMVFPEVVSLGSYRILRNSMRFPVERFTLHSLHCFSKKIPKPHTGRSPNISHRARKGSHREGIHNYRPRSSIRRIRPSTALRHCLGHPRRQREYIFLFRTKVLNVVCVGEVLLSRSFLPSPE